METITKTSREWNYAGNTYPTLRRAVQAIIDRGITDSIQLICPAYTMLEMAQEKLDDPKYYPVRLSFGSYEKIYQRPEDVPNNVDFMVMEYNCK